MLQSVNFKNCKCIMYHSILFRPNGLFFVFFFFSKIVDRFFPGGPVVKNTPANAGDTGSIPEPGRLHMLLSS